MLLRFLLRFSSLAPVLGFLQSIAAAAQPVSPYYDRVAFVSSTTGTGSVTIGSIYSALYQTPATAGVPISGAGIALGSYVSSLGTGGTGTYTLSQSSSVGSETMYARAALTLDGTHANAEGYNLIAASGLIGPATFRLPTP